MNAPIEQSRNALATQGVLLLNALRTVQAEQWRNPSRLPGWSIHVLVAHTLRCPRGIVEYVNRPLTDGPIQNAVSYWNMDGKVNAQGISDRAIETAAQQPTRTLVADFEATLNAAIQTLTSYPPDHFLPSIFGPITLEDFALTRVLELTIHSLDITESLGLPPSLDPLAMRLSEQLLVELGSTHRPGGMDDATYLDAAAGRRRIPSITVPIAFQS